MFQTNNPGAWLEIGAYPYWVKNTVQGVHDPICDAATAGDPGPKYQSVYEWLSIGAIDSALLSLNFYSWLFLVADNRPDNRSLQHQCLPVLPECHYGNTLVKPLGPPEGRVVNIPR